MTEEARIVQLPEQPRRCLATTAKGRPCRNRPLPSGPFCRVHAGAEARPRALPRDLQALMDFLGRRMRGEYETDIFGFDQELTELLLPVIEPLNNRYWRVEVIGNQHIPKEGAALLASNHAGTLPIDGMVLRGLVWEHPPHRHARMLAADLVFTIPFLSHVVRKTGNTMACSEDTHRLLEMGELVAVFPEGFKGVGKGWKERYRLQRFGRGGFVEVAIQAQVPIIPVAIVGSEEIYPMIADVRPIARLFGFPYFPVTMFFPWLGPVGMIPLPSKWIVEFCEPIRTDHLSPDAAKDPMEIFDITDQVRQSIQQTLLKNLRRRRTIFG